MFTESKREKEREKKREEKKEEKAGRFVTQSKRKFDQFEWNS